MKSQPPLDPATPVSVMIPVPADPPPLVPPLLVPPLLVPPFPELPPLFPCVELALHAPIAPRAESKRQVESVAAHGDTVTTCTFPDESLVHTAPHVLEP